MIINTNQNKKKTTIGNFSGSSNFMIYDYNDMISKTTTLISYSKRLRVVHKDVYYTKKIEYCEQIQQQQQQRSDYNFSFSCLIKRIIFSIIILSKSC